MARTPNSLPHSKQSYVRTLVLRRQVMNTLQVQAGGIALNMYHSEVPLETARRFINNLVARQFWAAYDPQELYYDEVVQMFTEAGASQGEAAQYANTLEHKRQLAQ